MPIGIGIAQLRFPNSATFDLILLLILSDRDEEKEWTEWWGLGRNEALE